MDAGLKVLTALCNHWSIAHMDSRDILGKNTNYPSAMRNFTIYTEPTGHREGVHGLYLCTYCYISLQQPLLYVKEPNVLVARTGKHTVISNTKLGSQTSTGAEVCYRTKHKGYRRYKGQSIALISMDWVHVVS